MGTAGKRLIGLPVLIVTAALICCSDGDSSDANGSSVQFSVELTSIYRVLHEVGPGNRVIYGLNQFTGTTDIDGQQATVELLGSLDYVDGSGDFFGFVTIVLADGSTLGLRMTEGRTDAATDTTNATFSSPLLVVGGTGKYLNAGGSGTFEGERSEALGGLVDATFHVDISSELSSQ
jgi:hypothetical protein